MAKKCSEILLKKKPYLVTTDMTEKHPKILLNILGLDATCHTNVLKS